MKATSSLGRRKQSQLIDERNRLRSLFKGLRDAATSRGDYEPHDVTDDEAAIQADAIEARLTAIDSALARIKSGGYGVCVACGGAIAPARLHALPAATVCRECAR
jgi:RNA polymerase-binding transcription factor DksA